MVVALVEDKEDNATEQAGKGSSQSKKIRKSLGILKRKQMMKRTEDIYQKIVNECKNEGIDIDTMLGLLLTRSNSKRIGELGELVVNNGVAENKNVMTNQKAATIYTDLKLGRETYTQMKKIVQSSGFPVFPSWAQVRRFQSDVTPAELRHLPEPEKGVYFQFKDACSTTQGRIMKQLQENALLSSTSLTMHIKYGFNGSGGHSMFNQLNNTKTHNMILTIFCPLKIKDQSVKSNLGTTNTKCSNFAESVDDSEGNRIH